MTNLGHLTDEIHAALIDETKPWPLPPPVQISEALVDDLLEAFLGQFELGDALFIFMEHDLIMTEEVDRLSWGDYQTFKPLIRRAYLDAVAQGLVPGRLN